MIFRTLYLENFRNIESLSFAPGEGVNVIWGDNAQGKTNLIEALWLFTGAKSFRRTRDSELLRFGAERAMLKASFFSEGRDQTAEIIFSPSKSMKKNGIEIRGPSDYAGTCGGVVFSPEQMNFFRDGPKERRRLIDTSLCQISPKYLSVLSDYKKVLEQRNSLLKDVKFHAQLLDLLDVYDEQLSRLGGILTRTRIRYGKSLEEKAQGIYEGISGGREKFSAFYMSTILPEEERADPEVSMDEWADLLRERLRATRASDLEHGATACGPHRDDLLISLDGKPAPTFGSQGQQRSCILALKLAEAKLLGERMGEPPLILLDDVMSELDSSRRGYILNSIGESQIFLTCCDPGLFAGLSGGKTFSMRNGILREERGTDF